MIAIVLPTDACNLRCKYCISRHGNHTMSDDILINTIAFSKDVFDDSSGQGHWEWHAGEPMLMGVDWYRKAETFIEDIGFDQRRIFCTNLTLLNDEWIEFCKEFGYGISTSLDGPQYIHDAMRGKGTWELVMQNLIKLEEAGIGYGCIAVLSKLSCANPLDVYNFFKESRINVKLNPINPIIDPVETCAALTTIFDAWYDDGALFSMEPLTKMIRYLLGRPYQTECTTFCNHAVFCVDVRGDVYPCERFFTCPSMDDQCFGNVNTDSFEDIWYGEKRTRFLEFIAMIDTECLKCPYVDWCGGGCAFDSIKHGRCDQKLGGTCGIYKPLFEHIEKRAGWIRRI